LSIFYRFVVELRLTNVIEADDDDDRAYSTLTFTTKTTIQSGSGGSKGWPGGAPCPCENSAPRVPLMKLVAR